MIKDIYTRCGYVYCQNMGDPDRNDISKGAPFEKVPENWECPKCGASEEEFKLCDKECDDEC